MRHFFRYYWALSKHFGFRVWETKGRELLSALLLAVITFLIGVLFKQVDALTALEIAVLALVAWLCVFAVGHLIHAPVLLHEGSHHAKAREQKWGFGVLGIVILLVIAGGVASLGMYFWTERTPTILLPTADQGP